MDANGLRFWLLGDARHWRAHSHTVWDAQCRVLRLASERTSAAARRRRLPRSQLRAARSSAFRAPWTRRVPWRTGTMRPARLSPAATCPSEAIACALGAAPTDLVVGFDGVLYCAMPDPSACTICAVAGPMSTVAAAGLRALASRGASERGRLGAGACQRTARALDRLAAAARTVRGLRRHRVPARSGELPSARVACPCRLELARWREPDRACQRSAKAGSPCCPGSVMVKRGCAAVDMRTERMQSALRADGARYAYALEWLDAERIARARAGPPRRARLRPRGGG